ncbi:hypothetical protein BVRB_2g046360 [Beta vulgaris subsp. vulgaris]|uniref:Uncharacterized protein n=1 Tax=Beta vulgaris subsp. vulgaris TaxID=3555 RepID=A0A0J8BGT2_BETVV|nr:hypothetical protein BVRB_2g046360 [Beta vulgaris subsp. vulgaris]
MKNYKSKRGKLSSGLNHHSRTISQPPQTPARSSVSIPLSRSSLVRIQI